MTRARVFLLSSFAQPAQDTHWASPYAALRRAFLEHPSDECELVDAPQDADLILICPRPRNPVWPVENFRGGIGWKHRAKCVVVSTDDDPTMTHKGFYTSLRASRAGSPHLRGGFYPCVSFGNPPGALAADDLRWLFSFLGSFETDPLRRQIGRLASSSWRDCGEAFLVKDTARAQHEQGLDAFRQEYLDSLRRSKFVLCPRGMSPSSLRLFETMKAARVPVVIADEWVPPRRVAWDRFVIRVGERDVAAIPQILASEAGSFGERARAAHEAWQEHFDAAVLARTVTRWGLELVRDDAHGASRIAHVCALAGQLVRWRFLRRGVASEILRALRPAASEKA